MFIVDKSLVVPKGQVATSLKSIFEEYDSILCEINDLYEKTRHSRAVDFFLSGNRITGGMRDHVFGLEGAIKSLNAAFWNKAIKATDVLSFMPAVDRNKWSDDIHEMRTPPFDKESVLRTIESLLLSRGDFLAKKVEGVFNRLSPHHVTNKSMSFHTMFIMDYLISSYGMVNFDRVEYLNDLRNVIAKILNLGEAPYGLLRTEIDGYIDSESWGKWLELDGGAWHLRIYRKGTVHIKIHEAIAEKLNEILATCGPRNLGEKKKSSSKKDKDKRREFAVELLSFETRNALMNLKYANRPYGTVVVLGDKVSASCLGEIKEVITHLRGADIVMSDESWTFSYNPSQLIKDIAKRGYLNTDKSSQFYPTPSLVAAIMLDMADRELPVGEEENSVLEPSAGLGSLVENVYPKNVVCIEKDEVRAGYLKLKGYKTICADFLDIPENAYQAKVCLMNPPFSEGDAERHFKHATTQIRKGGVIVAILPSGLPDRLKKQGFKFSEITAINKTRFGSVEVSVQIVKYVRE